METTLVAENVGPSTLFRTYPVKLVDSKTTKSTVTLATEGEVFFGIALNTAVKDHPVVISIQSGRVYSNQTLYLNSAYISVAEEIKSLNRLHFDTRLPEKVYTMLATTTTVLYPSGLTKQFNIGAAGLTEVVPAKEEAKGGEGVEEKEGLSTRVYVKKLGDAGFTEVVAAKKEKEGEPKKPTIGEVASRDHYEHYRRECELECPRYLAQLEAQCKQEIGRPNIGLWFTIPTQYGARSELRNLFLRHGFQLDFHRSVLTPCPNANPMTLGGKFQETVHAILTKKVTYAEVRVAYWIDKFKQICTPNNGFYEVWEMKMDEYDRNDVDVMCAFEKWLDSEGLVLEGCNQDLKFHVSFDVKKKVKDERPV